MGSVGWTGGVAEWSIAAVLKTAAPRKGAGGSNPSPSANAQVCNVNNYTSLVIWVAVIGGIFVLLWRKGYLLRLRNYVLETKEELRKCSWPSKEELGGNTIVVFAALALLGAFTVAADFIYSIVIRAITS